MGFVDFFRPRWKHSDVEVRAEAVRQLGADDRDILSRVAKGDQDVRVRRIAVKKIDSPELLGDIAASDPDEGLRRTAADKAAELLLSLAIAYGDETKSREALARLSSPRALADVAKQASLDAIRRAALERLSDEKALADVARNAKEAPVRREATARLTDAVALREIAIHEAMKEVGLCALGKISDSEALELIAKRAKSKAVRDLAREKLAEGTQPETPSGRRSSGNLEAQARLARRRAREVQLCQAVESLSARSDWDRADEELSAVQASFAELGPFDGEDAELKARFDKACERFQQRRSEFMKLAREHATHAEHGAEEEANRQRRIEEHASALVARIAVCETLEALAGEGLEARVEEAKSAWSRLGPPPPERRTELERRFNRACAGALKRQEHAFSGQTVKLRMEELCVEAEGLKETEKSVEHRLMALQREWRELEVAAPNEEELKRRFVAAEERIAARRAEERARREEEANANLARLEELSAALEGTIAVEDRKQADQTMRAAQAGFQSLGPLPKERQAAAKERFQAAREKLAARLQEMREAEDWKRWANVPRLEKLCARVEGLLELTDTKQMAQELKAAQAEWKTVGPAPRERSEALWNRFRQAGDQVHQRLGAHSAQVDQDREANLKRKEELCVRVEGLVDSTDWKETAELIKRLQEEWKGVGPTPREQGEAAWKRFREACDKFFERRKAHFDQESGERGENLKKKEELCGRAEALAGSTQWKEAAEQLKRLQEEWKEIGPVPREQGDAVWKRFREACDQFFERRKEHFEKLDEERAANLKKKEELCAKVEALLEAGDPEAQVAEVKALQAEWKKVGPAPRDQGDAIWKRFREACDRFFEGPKEELEPEAPPQPADGTSRFVNKLPLEAIAGLIERSAEEATEPPRPAGGTPATETDEEAPEPTAENQ